MEFEETLSQCLVHLVSELASDDAEKRIGRRVEKFYVERVESQEESGRLLTFNIEDQDVPDVLAVHSTVLRLVDTDPVFRESAVKLAEIRSEHAPTAVQPDLFQAFFKIAMMILEPSLSKRIVDTIPDVTRKLSEELSTGMCDWRLGTAIFGMNVSHSMKVGELFTLNRLKATDTLRRMPIYMLSVSPEFSPPAPLTGSTVMDVMGRSRDSLDLQDRVQLYLQLLRLFRVGSIGASHVDMIPDSLVRMSFSSVFRRSLPPLVIGFEFRDGDVEKFVEFAAEYGGIIGRIGKGKSRKLGSLGVGLSRYNSALLDSSNLETRIVNAISSLEAILLNDSQELKYKLSMRTAGVLQPFYEDAREIVGYVKAAYEIRSQYLHGKETKKRAELPDTAGRMLELSRRVLLISMKLIPDVGPGRFVDSIDAALVDPRMMKSLCDSINMYGIAPFITEE